ncbi:MAG: glucan biosynthesis protein [Paracoccaceae bacterium]
MLRRDLIRALALGPAGLAVARPAAASADAPELPRLGPAEPFDFDRLVSRARALAREPFRPAEVAAPDRLHALTFSEHWRIRYREDAAFAPAGEDLPVQLFHPARFFPEPVAIHVVEGGEAREVLFSSDYFEIPEDSPARGLPEGTGFAGLRVMRPGQEPDWVSFLGASYFRADGPERQYGLSARGIAVDTGLPTPEEFPRFTAFWLGPPEVEGTDLTVWALLDGPSVTGAYRFALAREGAMPGQSVEARARLFLRAGVERIGVAPLTSMYWYSERDGMGADDWRPEIHDSDGLALHTGSGERIWRAIRNPDTVRTSSFFDESPRGFGLIQRDRVFAHYQDDGVWYDRRPSAWVEPLGDWGRGAVQLIEIPTEDETFDNLVAYWLPEGARTPGEELAFDYRLHFTDRDPELPGGLARAVATRQGQGGTPGDPIPPGVDKMVIDFEGEALADLAGPDYSEGASAEARAGDVAVKVEIAGGELASEASVRPVLAAERTWRVMFDYRLTGRDPADLRVHLEGRDGRALSETWVTQAGVDRFG